jgi:apolipoprotein N-acyltransferase
MRKSAQLAKTGGTKDLYKGRVFLILLMVLSSLLVNLSFPPFNFGILAWFGLAPFLYAIRQRGYLCAAFLGFLFGCIFCVGTFSWALRIDSFNIINFSLSVIFFSSFFLVFALFYNFIAQKRSPWMIVGAPGLWVIQEYVRSNFFFLSMPWNLLGHSQHLQPILIQIADITGVYGISFCIVTVSQFLSQLPDSLRYLRKTNPLGVNSFLRKEGAINLVVTGMTFGIVIFYGWTKLPLPPHKMSIRVAVIQANVVTQRNMPLSEQVAHLKAYQRLTLKAAEENPVLIVWPSSSLPAPLSSRIVRFTISRLAQETGCYLLVGGAGQEKGQLRVQGEPTFSNSEFLISPSGRLVKQYHKIKLLPFNEYIPLKDTIKWPVWISALEEEAIPGDEYSLFQIPGATFAAPICSENMFPDLFRQFVKKGAEFIASVTNEEFFKDTPVPYLQSLAINVFRAVENRVYIVRAATTGISGFIDATGRIVETIKGDNGEILFVSGALVKEIPLLTENTFYTRFGDVFAYVIIILTGLILIVSFKHKREKLDEF